jgi:hypothetical protein
MFAVVILGIGFIMLASIFPVAIKQSQLNTEETAAVAVARNGINVMTPLASQDNPRDADPTLETPLLPVSRNPIPGMPGGTADYSFRFGQVYSLRDRRIETMTDYPAPPPNALLPLTMPVPEQRRGMWQATSGNLIQSGDPRFAWVPLYRRDAIFSRRDGVEGVSPFPYAQLIVIGCVARNRSTFGPADVTPAGNNQAAQDQHLTQLEPKPVAVRIQLIDSINPSSGYCIKFFSINQLNNPDRGGFPASTPPAVYDRVPTDAIAEGTFVVIADDRMISLAGTNVISRNSGRMNGRIYRVGVRRTDLDGQSGDPPNAATWTLQPGFDFSPDPGDNGEFESSPAGDADDINRLGVNGTPYNDVTVNSIRTFGGKVRFAGNGAGVGCVAYVIGRGYTNPATTPGAGGDYDGATQDVAVYTTFVPVR